MNKILDEIRDERYRQDLKWGQQDHPSISAMCHEVSPEDYPVYYDLPHETTVKDNCEEAFKHGEGSYAHIAVEEMVEVVAAPDDQARREELIQLAAVCVAWVESIDRAALAAQGLEAF